METPQTFFGKDRHTNIDLCLCTKQLQNMQNIFCSSSKQAIYFAVWYKNSILVFAKNIRSVMVLGFVKGYIKYTCNYFIMFKEKSLAKLCLRAPNDIFNVLPPNICQCLQCRGVAFCRLNTNSPKRRAALLSHFVIQRI